MSNQAPTATLEELLAHVGWVRRLARRLTADADDAEDLLQETWMQAAQHPPTTDRSLRPWLAVVLRNLWVKRTQAARRREARHAAVACAPVELSPERLAEQVESQRLLVELVAGLDEPYRQALVLRYFEELSGAEIARRLGVPAGTVRWRLKVALDGLRRELDERHGGRRAVWTAALLPLAGAGMLRPRPTGAGTLRPLTGAGTLQPRPGASLAIGLVGATLALGLVFTRCAVEAPPDARGLVARLAALAPAGRIPSFRTEALPAGDLGACRLEVQRLRAERAALEPKRLALLSPEQRFSEGAPNPAAVAALEPAIARAFRGRPGAPQFSLECRTWVCRVVLLAPTREDEPWRSNWHNVLFDDDDVWERVYLMQPLAANPTRDQVSGEALTEVEAFLPLRHPSAARVEWTATQTPVVPDAPLPDSAKSCAAERERLRLDLQEQRAFIAARAPLEPRFAAGSPNPKLTAEVRRRLIAAFPGMYTATVEVQCRDDICGASWRTGPRHWAVETDRDPWFRTMTARLDGTSSTPPSPGKRAAAHEWYLQILPTPRADGSTLLRDLVDRFERSTLPDDCAARFPATGSLHVRFDLRGSAVGPGPDDPPRLSARLGHGLAGTPLGNCMQQAIEAHVLSAPLPSPITHASDYRSFDFPRPRGGDSAAAPALGWSDRAVVVVVRGPTRR